VPRAIFVDLEPRTVDYVWSGTYGKLFRLENSAVGHTGTGYNWAKGHYTDGKKFIDLVRLG
jgi:hypothetical protein